MSGPVYFSRDSPSSGITARVGARLRSQIDFVLVPTPSPDHDDEERVLLLVDSDDASSASASEPHLFRQLRVTPLLSGALPSDSRILDAAVSAHDDRLYFIASDAAKLFNLSLAEGTVTSHAVDIYPEHVRLSADGCALLSGWTEAGRCGQNLLLRLNLASGAVTSRTRPFDVEKFGAFDLAHNGASLWLASPSQSSEKAEKSQVFELSADFRKKIHFLSLNSDRYRLKPLCLTTDERTVFVSASRTPLEEDGEEEGRLLTFPAAPGPGEVTKTKDWLSVTSWNFPALRPGRLVVLGGAKDRSRRLLVLDRRYGSLHLIVWRRSDLPADPLCLPVHLEGLQEDGAQAKVLALGLGPRVLYVMTESAIFSAATDSLYD